MVNKLVLVWFRRDLRITDNTALRRAYARAKEVGGQVLPVYFAEKKLLTGPNSSNNRNLFWSQSLLELQENLRTMNSDILIVDGSARSSILELINKIRSIQPPNQRNYEVDSFYFNEDYTEFSRRRDEEVASILKDQNVEINPCKDLVVYHKDEVSKADKSIYSVFTPYKNAWLKKYSVEAGEFAASLSKNYDEEFRISLENLLVKKSAKDNVFDSIEKSTDFVKIFDLKEWANKLEKNPFLAQKGGEKSAQTAVKNFFLNKIYSYSVTRNRADINGTSKLSAHLKFGTISIRKLVANTFHYIEKAPDSASRASCEIYLSELIWREFYQMILANHPHVEKEEFQKKYIGISWENNFKKFEAWKNGLTGYPFIDAAMRELNQTGWMHNRGRMAVAMFLTKDLDVDWRLGEKYFMEKLVDGDTAANNGGWQWSASTGTDAAPYFRIFNPVTQGLKCDPNGDYVRKWVPELAMIKDKKIHAPWELDPIILRADHEIELGESYPERIVDHYIARDKSIAKYKFEADK